MFTSTPVMSQIGQSLHYLFMGGTLQPTSLPSRDLRMGLSQVLWREGSTTSRNLALGLIKSDVESYANTVTALADHFSQNPDFAAALTQGVAEKAQHNEAFAHELAEAARSSFESLMKGGDELPPSSDSRRRGRKSDAPYGSIWEASVQRIADPEV